MQGRAESFPEISELGTSLVRDAVPSPVFGDEEDKRLSCGPSPALNRISEAAFALCVSVVPAILCDWDLGAFVTHQDRFMVGKQPFVTISIVSSI